MAETKIEWTVTSGQDGVIHGGFTMNFWIGCTELSAACDHCYARTMSERYGWAQWGNHPRHRTSEANWRKPLAWNARAKKLGARLKVFTNSLADFFDNQVDTDWREAAWRTILECDALDWLVLTKRPQNIARMLPGGIDQPKWPWPNVWLGTTAENQEEADRRIWPLLRVPAAVHFLSCEPLLGPIDLTNVDPPDTGYGGEAHGKDFLSPHNRSLRSQLDWVITGGESGPNARPAHPDWIRSLRDQCAGAGVPFFFKQWGEFLDFDHLGDRWNDMSHAARGNQVPLAGKAMIRVGKKAAGALLDGIEWREMPARAA